MTATVMDRQALKAACMELLDSAAVEHPAGHQGKLAARYVLRATSGDRVELMFEKGDKTPANLWVEKSYATGLLDRAIVSREYPAAALFSAKEDDGPRVYGRHAALKPMRALAHADLLRFTITSPAEMEQVLRYLMNTKG